MQPIKKQRYHFVNKYPYSQIYGFLRSYVWMWELDCKEDWIPKNWCFQTVVLKWESLSFVRSNQSVIKEINLECSLEGLILKLKLWPSDVKSWPLGKDPMLGQIEGRGRRGRQRTRWLDQKQNMCACMLHMHIFVHIHYDNICKLKTIFEPSCLGMPHWLTSLWILNKAQGTSGDWK